MIFSLNSFFHLTFMWQYLIFVIIGASGKVLISQHFNVKKVFKESKSQVWQLKIIQIRIKYWRESRNISIGFSYLFSLKNKNNVKNIFIWILENIFFKDILKTSTKLKTKYWFSIFSWKWKRELLTWDDSWVFYNCQFYLSFLCFLRQLLTLPLI